MIKAIALASRDIFDFSSISFTFIHHLQLLCVLD